MSPNALRVRFVFITPLVPRMAVCFLLAVAAYHAETGVSHPSGNLPEGVVLCLGVWLRVSEFVTKM